MIHLIFLHFSGSSNPSGTNPNFDKIKFLPYYAIKDMTPIIPIMVILSLLISNKPDLLGDPENFNPASMTTTPTHIKPE
jgi:quinol-cytochrome oxidoreductase complex cytochrome b subunit